MHFWMHTWEKSNISAFLLLWLHVGILPFVLITLITCMSTKTAAIIGKASKVILPVTGCKGASRLCKCKRSSSFKNTATNLLLLVLIHSCQISSFFFFPFHLLCLQLLSPAEHYFSKSLTLSDVTMEALYLPLVLIFVNLGWLWSSVRLSVSVMWILTHWLEECWYQCSQQHLIWRNLSHVPVTSFFACQSLPKTTVPSFIIFSFILVIHHAVWYFTLIELYLNTKG